MGDEFEVEAWTYIGKNKETEISIKDYEYVVHYSGDDMLVALSTMEKLKADGVGCVKLTWR